MNIVNYISSYITNSRNLNTCGAMCGFAFGGGMSSTYFDKFHNNNFFVHTGALVLATFSGVGLSIMLQKFLPKAVYPYLISSLFLISSLKICHSVKHLCIGK